MNLPSGAEIGLYFPDGIRRDRERGRKALGVIASHPIWFAGVMLRRIGAHLKLFGKPAPNVGTAGINVTAEKTLSPARQGGVIAFLVKVLGMIQSVVRTIVLPLMLVGVVIAWRRDWRMTALLLVTVALLPVHAGNWSFGDSLRAADAGAALSVCGHDSRRVCSFCAAQVACSRRMMMPGHAGLRRGNHFWANIQVNVNERRNC